MLPATTSAEPGQMSTSDPRSWFDRLIGVCLGLLVGAVAVYVAVRLIEAVWTVLLVILGAGALLVLAVGLLRRRDRGGW